MKYALYILAFPGFALLIFSAGVFDGQKPQPSNDLQTEQPGASQGQWETKSDDQPPVTVKVTPLELGKDAATWKFNIVLDTHSGSLDDDMLAAAVLLDDAGNRYQPAAWEGAGPGGHHREGVLVFDPINPAPSRVTLTIKNVGGVSQRSFTWNIQ